MMKCRGFLLPLFLCLALVGCSKKTPHQDKKPNVMGIVISQSTHQQRWTYPGTIEPLDEATLSFEVPGVVARTYVDVSDHVKQGQVLATLVQSEYRYQLAKAQSQLEQAQHELHYAKQNYLRFQKLYKQKSISADEYDQVRTNLLIANNKVSSAQATVDEDQKQLNDTTLKAPFAGVITLRHINAAEKVQSGTPVYDLQTVGQWEVSLHVPENAVTHIHLSNACTVTSVVLPKQAFAAQIKYIGSRTTKQHTYPIKLLIQQKSTQLKAGMSAQVTCKTDQDAQHAHPVFHLPVTALASDKQKAFFVFEYVASSHTLAKIPIKLISIQHGTAAVASDQLKTGMTIVKGGTHTLQAGEKVNLIDAHE